MYMEEDGMDLTQETEEQQLLRELESALDSKDAFKNSEIMAARFSELDAASRRRLYEVTKKLKYEESRMKVAWVLEVMKKNKQMFEGPD